MSERANIRDVAARAGVAVKTVSRVLNGHPYVSAETRERVEEAVRALEAHGEPDSLQERQDRALVEGGVVGRHVRALAERRLHARLAEREPALHHLRVGIYPVRAGKARRGAPADSGHCQEKERDGPHVLRR